MDEKTIKKLLGQRIKQLRKKQNLTQFALGEKIGIDQRQIAYIEGGNCFPSLKTLNKFSDAFNCQMKDLFDYGYDTTGMDLRKAITEKATNLNDKNLNLYYQLLMFLENNI